MKQVVIVRKDLALSPALLASECCKASFEFIMCNIRKKQSISIDYTIDGIDYTTLKAPIQLDVFSKWLLNEDQQQTICEVANKNKLLHAKNIAKKLGLKEGKDYFLIYDKCNKTGIVSEEENGTTLVCIGFAPLDDDVVSKLIKPFKLYRGC